MFSSAMKHVLLHVVWISKHLSAVARVIFFVKCICIGIRLFLRLQSHTSCLVRRMCSIVGIADHLRLLVHVVQNILHCYAVLRSTYFVVQSIAEFCSCESCQFMFMMAKVTVWTCPFGWRDGVFNWFWQKMVWEVTVLHVLSRVNIWLQFWSGFGQFECCVCNIVN